MTISASLLEILVCPKCRKPVIATQEGDFLTCNHCQLHYPVRDGIPVMMLDEAQVALTSE